MKEDDIYEMLTRLFSTMPKLTHSEIELVIREEYEAAFRIRPPGFQENQYPLVATQMFPAEDYTYEGLLREYMLQFARRKVALNFMPWDQWKRLPSFEADEIMAAAAIFNEEQDRRTPSVDAMLAEANKGGKV